MQIIVPYVLATIRMLYSLPCIGEQILTGRCCLQLLDLFTLDSGKGGSGTGTDAGGSSSSSSIGGGRETAALGLGAAGAKAVLEGLPELWDPDQYEAEYDLDTFMSTLKK